MATFFLFSLILVLSSSSSSSALLFNAAEILSDSGHLSMALTLQLVYQTPLISQSPTSTVFAPSNAAFIQSGQPSLNQLQYQISPLLLSIKTLKTLPYGTKIPTFLSNHSLVVTSSPSSSQLSINNIKINETAMFEDKKSLIIYGVDGFFNSSFQIPPNLAPVPIPVPAPVPTPVPVPVPVPDPYPNSIAEHDILSLRHPFDFYAKASNLLRSRGYNRMATFLEMQLVGVMGKLKLTIFAPADGEIDEYVKGNFSDYSWIFKQHVVPHWLTFSELNRVYDGTLLQTFSERFEIEVTRSGDVIEINSVPITFPDMYYSDWLVVHGLQRSIVAT